MLECACTVGVDFKGEIGIVELSTIWRRLKRRFKVVEFHEVADIFPLMTGDEFKEFIEDIKINGQKEPILLADGKIADGRNRYLACRELHILPDTKNWDGKGSLISHVISLNFRRRHLTSSQKAAVGAEIEPMLAKEAKQRQVEAGEKFGENHPQVIDSKSKEVVAKMPQPLDLKSKEVVEKIPPAKKQKENKARTHAAKITGSSPRYVSDAKKIKEKSPEVFKEVKSGTINIPDAKKIINMPVAKQQKIIQEVKTDKVKDVKEAITQIKKEETLQKEQEQAKATLWPSLIYKQSAVDFLNKYEDESIDLLLTDPPYSTDIDDLQGFIDSWVLLSLDKIKPTGRAYICTGAYPKELYAYLGTLLSQNKFSLENILVWTYRNTLGPSPAKIYKLNWQAIFYLIGPEAKKLDCPIMLEQFSVQDINAPDGRLGNRFHTWQKPDELAERFIKHSTVSGDTIIDPFAGTGTFILAGSRLGRKSFGGDIDNEMIKLAVQRGCVEK